MRKALIGLLMGVGVLSGCASVAMVDPQRDAAAKTFVAPADKAGLYVYRNELIGSAVKMDVAIDGKDVGQTVAKTYLYKEVAPGKHVITSSAEDTAILEVDTRPGALYYVWQEVKMGILFARSKLHLVGEEEGRKGVLETRMIETR